MTCYPCIQITFDMLIDFKIPFSLLLFDHWLLPTFMALRLHFAATKQRFAVLGWTSNNFVNKHSYFLSRGFLTGVDVICTLGLLSVTPYGVDNISAYIIFWGFFYHCTCLHVDISLWFCSCIYVKKKTFCIMIGQYQ